MLKLNNAESTNDIDNAKGYVDSDGVFHPVTEDEQLFKENERLLARLTNAASNKTSSKENNDPNDYT